MTLKDKILHRLFWSFPQNASDFRFGQWIFVNVTTRLCAKFNVESQPQAIMLATNSDELLFYALSKEGLCTDWKLCLDYYLKNREMAKIFILFKKYITTHPEVSSLGTVLEACRLGDSLKTPSVLYFVEDKSMVEGLEAMLAKQQ